MNAKLTVDVSGSDFLLREAIRQVRSEVVAALGKIAATEKDSRVVMRLNEIGAELQGTLTSVESNLAMSSAPNPNEGRRVNVEAADGN